MLRSLIVTEKDNINTSDHIGPISVEECDMTALANGTNARWKGVLLPTMLVLALLLGGPLAAEEEPEPYIPWYDAEIVIVDSWKDPQAEGAPIMFHTSSDGTKLLVSGFEGADDLRVMDRAGKTLSVLDLPMENATIKGILWTWGETWLTAWGSSEGNDTDWFAMWDADTYEPTGEVFENGTTPLPIVDAAYFMADDFIVVLAGRDINGTSRVLVLETPDLGVRADIAWKDNTTVLFMGTDGSDVLVADELGAITTIGSSSWSELNRYEGFDTRPTAVSFASSQEPKPWMLGYEDGRTFFWKCCPWAPAGNGSHGPGPLQALTWIELDEVELHVLAVPSEGGSTLSAHRTYFEHEGRDRISGPLFTEGAATMMATDPMVPGQVWAGFSDGTLALLNVTLTVDEPPQADVFEPEHTTALIRGTVMFRGNVTDDHDNITWVRVRLDDGEWEDAEWADGEWWFELDTTDISGESLVLYVKAFDGRTESFEWRVFYNFLGPGKGPDRMEHFWYWFTGCTSMVVIMVVVLYYSLWRGKPKRRPEDTEDKTSPSR